MSLRIVRLGSPRSRDEGLRIGTVRRLPRGVRKDRYAAEDWFDVWYPELAPSTELLSQGRAAKSDKEWKAFLQSFRAEMNEPRPPAHARSARRPVAPCPFLGRVLLRRRIAVPSVGSSRPSRRARGIDQVIQFGPA